MLGIINKKLFRSVTLMYHVPHYTYMIRDILLSYITLLSHSLPGIFFILICYLILLTKINLLNTQFNINLL